MKLSTRTRYGSRALTELAAVYPKQVLPLKSVAAKQHISLKYLESIMSALKVAGLVRPTRGVHGGYCLTRKPDDVTLRDVFEALEGSLAPVDCVNAPGTCPFEATCPTQETWIELRNVLGKALERTTLQDLVARKKKKERQASKA